MTERPDLRGLSPRERLAAIEAYFDDIMNTAARRARTDAACRDDDPDMFDVEYDAWQREFAAWREGFWRYLVSMCATGRDEPFES